MAAAALLAFRDVTHDQRTAIPFSFPDYVQLVDWTGRAVREDKRGAIDDRLPSIMQRLNIDADAWRQTMQPRGIVFGRALGQLDHLRLHVWGPWAIMGARAAAGRADASDRLIPAHSRSHEAGPREPPSRPAFSASHAAADVSLRTTLRVTAHA